MGVLNLTVEHGKRRLSVQIMGEKFEWVCLAVEGPAGGPGLDALMQDHAHHTIGIFRGLGEAMHSAERYAKAWQRKRASGDMCACKDIEAAS